MSSAPGSLSIGQLAREVDAQPSALRYWERQGLLEPTERVNGKRRYTPGAVQRVGMVRLLQDAGFGIREIRELLATDPRGEGPWRAQGEAKLAEIRQQVARLQTAADFLEHGLKCPHPSLAECPTFTAFMRWRAAGGDPTVDPHDLPPAPD